MESQFVPDNWPQKVACTTLQNLADYSIPRWRTSLLPTSPEFRDSAYSPGPDQRFFSRRNFAHDRPRALPYGRSITT